MHDSVIGAARSVLSNCARQVMALPATPCFHMEHVFYFPWKRCCASPRRHHPKEDIACEQYWIPLYSGA